MPCAVGVPFINVITDWDWNHPEDEYRWRTQNDELKQYGPPYDYRVVSHTLTR